MGGLAGDNRAVEVYAVLRLRNVPGAGSSREGAARKSTQAAAALEIGHAVACGEQMGREGSRLAWGRSGLSSWSLTAPQCLGGHEFVFGTSYTNCERAKTSTSAHHSESGKLGALPTVPLAHCQVHS
jgi:hypothetical protein